METEVPLIERLGAWKAREHTPAASAEFSRPSFEAPGITVRRDRARKGAPAHAGALADASAHRPKGGGRQNLGRISGLLTGSGFACEPRRRGLPWRKPRRRPLSPRR